MIGCYNPNRVAFDQTSCVVCREDYNPNDLIATLPCKHISHLVCRTISTETRCYSCQNKYIKAPHFHPNTQTTEKLGQVFEKIHPQNKELQEACNQLAIAQYSAHFNRAVFPIDLEALLDTISSFLTAFDNKQDSTELIRNHRQFARHIISYIGFCQRQEKQKTAFTPKELKELKSQFQSYIDQYHIEVPLKTLLHEILDTIFGIDHSKSLLNQISEAFHSAYQFLQMTQSDRLPQMSKKEMLSYFLLLRFILPRYQAFLGLALLTLLYPFLAMTAIGLVKSLSHVNES